MSNNRGFHSYDLRTRLYKPFKSVEELSAELSSKRLAESKQPCAVHSGGKTQVYAYVRHPVPEHWVDNPNVEIHFYDDDGKIMN